MATNTPQLSIDEPGIGLLLVFSVIQFVLYNSILLLLESNFFSKLNFSFCLPSKKKKLNIIHDIVDNNFDKVSIIKNFYSYTAWLQFF